MIDRGIGVLLAIVGLASLAVVISKKSDTAKVLTAFLDGFSGTIRAAASPITGK